MWIGLRLAFVIVSQIIKCTEYYCTQGTSFYHKTPGMGIDIVVACLQFFRILNVMPLFGFFIELLTLCVSRNLLE